jgi:hypothetical protein
VNSEHPPFEKRERAIINYKNSRRSFLVTALESHSLQTPLNNFFRMIFFAKKGGGGAGVHRFLGAATPYPVVTETVRSRLKRMGLQMKLDGRLRRQAKARVTHPLVFLEICAGEGVSEGGLQNLHKQRS